MTLIKTLRTPKLFNIAIFDCVATLISAILIGKYIFKFNNIFDMTIWIIIVFAFGVFIHYLFDINTMVGYYLGINDKPDRKDDNQKMNMN